MKLKFYILIVIATLFVVMLGVNTYESAKAQMLELSNKNKIATSQNILNAFGSWFDERISSLLRASKFIERSNILANDAQIESFLKIFAQNSPEFDLVQLLKDDGEIFINGKKLLSPQNEKIPRNGLIWYLETKTSLKPTVNFMPKHNILGKETLNFCVPNFYEDKFNAVLCGVVRIENIFEKIGNFKLPPNSYSFIITHNGEILTYMSDEKLKNQIEDEFKKIFLNDSERNELNLGSNFISISEIKFLNWFVGAGADDEKEINELLNKVGVNAVILLAGFIILAMFANFLHNFMYERINASKKEYELILAHKARMSEIGELISGINHQFIQPVNSLNLILSTLIMLKKDGKLDDESLDRFLISGKRSIALLSDTIEIFRNFYNSAENVSEFSVKQSIKNLLTLMHTELSRANVSVNLKGFEDQKVNQIENIIQQILLILLHNAKDAVVEKFKEDFKLRQIDIDVKFDEKNCYIDVSEFGGGVDSQMINRIFQTPKTTKKFGSGIGLYFGKKLANEKINGDLNLINPSGPTIFRFSFEINLKAKR